MGEEAGKTRENHVLIRERERGDGTGSGKKLAHEDKPERGKKGMREETGSRTRLRPSL